MVINGYSQFISPDSMPFVAFINFIEDFAAQDHLVFIASISLVIVFESIDSDLTVCLKLLDVLYSSSQNSPVLIILWLFSVTLV